MSRDIPALVVRLAAGQTRAVVLVLHGGGENGRSTVSPWRAAYLRMVPIARDIHRYGRAAGVAVWQLRNRVWGWNGDDEDPVWDARWALDRIHAEHPGVPVILVGHSLGGRTALRVADDPAVTAVCALAPWTPDDEPVEPVTGRSVLIVHGLMDPMTSPRESRRYAVRAQSLAKRLARIELPGEAHAMLLRRGVWERLVRRFVLDEIAPAAGVSPLRTVWETPQEQRLRIRM